MPESQVAPEREVDSGQDHEDGMSVGSDGDVSVPGWARDSSGPEDELVPSVPADGGPQPQEQPETLRDCRVKFVPSPEPLILFDDESDE
jgi:hypothetical protein